MGFDKCMYTLIVISLKVVMTSWDVDCVLLKAVQICDECWNQANIMWWQIGIVILGSYHHRSLGLCHWRVFWVGGGSGGEEVGLGIGDGVFTIHFHHLLRLVLSFFP